MSRESGHGLKHGSGHGSGHGARHGSRHGSGHGSRHGSGHGSIYGSGHGLRNGWGRSNSIFVCRFCEHFAKNRGWTNINVHKSAHKILRIIAITRPFSQYRPREGLPRYSKTF